MGEADLVYQSRFKIVEDALALPGAVVGAVVGLVAFLAGNTELALYVWGAVALFIAPELPYLRSYLEALTRRRVALRADREGITFGARPGRPATDAEFIPWSETSAVLLWRAGRGLRGVRHVGVQRRDGSSPMWTSTTEPLTARIGDVFRPWHQPRREAGDQRWVHGWRLDRRRLKAVVAQVAPHVAVVDLW